jgi:hypothetical protein
MPRRLSEHALAWQKARRVKYRHVEGLFRRAYGAVEQFSGSNHHSIRQPPNDALPSLQGSHARSRAFQKRNVDGGTIRHSVG